MTNPFYMRVHDVLELFKPGDPHDWDTEFNLLLELHRYKIEDLAEDIEANGFKEPILLGYDGRVWDGHHRLMVAARFGHTHVPVEVTFKERF